jgi:putative FmdB family regulatory protein
VPYYEFLCKDCGPFEERRSHAEVGGPMACPACGEEARRVYSVPSTRRIPAGLSNAMHRVEKSAHEPDLARKAAGETWPGTRFHPGHGGHCNH